MSTSNSIEVKLVAEIESLLSKLKETPKASEEYSKLVERLSKLHKLKTEEHTQTTDDSAFVMPYGIKLPSLDTALIVAANIFGILWITRYEKENVVSTKSLSFLPKMK